MKKHSPLLSRSPLAGIFRLLGLLLVLLLPLSGLASAAPALPGADGDLDPTFGTDGITTTTFGGRSKDAGRKLLRQPDGKIIVVGDYSHYHLGALALARFNEDGTLDQTFGQSGWTYARSGWSDLTVADAALQLDGKIVVVGRSYRLGERWTDFQIVRFTAAGALDTTFGGSGIVLTDFGLNLADQAAAVAIQPDGKIVVAGDTTTSRPYPGGSEYIDYSRFIALARYNLDGSLDASFDQDGLLVITDPNEDVINGLVDLVVQADGKIVGLGNHSGSKLLRLNADGSLDASFGAAGWVSARGSLLALAAGGKFVTGGGGLEPSTYAYGILLERWNSDGSPDTTFDTDGLAFFEHFIYPYQVYDLVVQPDDKTLLSFTETAYSPDQGNFGAVRVNANGSLDTDFGWYGWLEDNYSNQDGSLGIVLQPDGKFWLGGYMESGYGDLDFFMHRYTAAGEYDTSGGWARLNLSTGSAIANTGIAAPDGKILAAGWYLGSQEYFGAGNFAGSQSVLAQYTPAGVLDPTFGSLGSTTMLTYTHNVEWNDMLRLPDGKLLLAGTTWFNDSFYNFRDVFLARYNPDGSLDTTFSEDGSFTLDLDPDPFLYANSNDRVLAIASQPDGKIVVAGYQDNSVTKPGFLVRLTAAGALDPTFDGDGVYIEPVQDATLDWVTLTFNDLVVQPDGKIVVAGQKSTSFLGMNQPGVRTYAFVAARFNPDGTPDTTFDGDGYAYVDVSSQPERLQGAQALVLQPDGMLVLAGYATADAQRDFALVRLTATGALDTSFSGDGKLLQDFSGGYDQANDLLLLPDGNLLVGGSSGLNGQRKFALARLTPGGALDPTFGTAGQLVQAVGETGSRADSQINKLLLQPDGRYVAVGQAWVNDNYQFALLRLQADNVYTLQPGDTRNLSGLGLSIHRPAGGPSACVYSVQRAALAPALGGGAITLPVTWSIASDCPTTPVDLTFTYSDAELAAAGLTEADQQAYQLSASLPWTSRGGAVDQAANQLSVAGVTPEGDWTLGTPLAANAAALGQNDTATIAGLTITRSADGPLRCIYTVDRTNSAPSLGSANLALPVSWSLSSSCPDLPVQLSFAYTDGELTAAGVTENHLLAFQRAGSDPWAARLGMANLAANQLILSAVTPDGDWTLAQPVALNAVSLSANQSATLSGVTVHRPAAGEPALACSYLIVRTNSMPDLGIAQIAMPVSWLIRSGCPSTAVDLTFAYTDFELAATGADENYLTAYRRTGSSWDGVPSTVNAAANQRTANDVLPDGEWTLAYLLMPPMETSTLMIGDTANINGVTIHRPFDMAAPFFCTYSVVRQRGVQDLGNSFVVLPDAWLIRTGCPDAPVDLSFPYSHADLDALGVAEAELRTYQQPTGGAWTLQTAAPDFTNHQFTVSGVTPTGYWTLAQPLAPNSVALDAGESATIAGVTIQRPSPLTQAPTLVCTYTVTRTNTAPNLGGAITALPVTWTISSSCSGVLVNLTFNYTDAELTAIGSHEANLQLYWQAAGAAWTVQPGTPNLAANQLTLAGVVPVGKWALAASIQPVSNDKFIYLPVINR